MPSNILTCYDHRLRSHHGLLLTITTAPSRLFTSRRRLSVPTAELAKICANDKLMVSRYGRGAAFPAFTRGWESRPSSTVKLSRIPPTLPSPTRFMPEQFRENESHQESLSPPFSVRWAKIACKGRRDARVVFLPAGGPALCCPTLSSRPRHTGPRRARGKRRHGVYALYHWPLASDGGDVVPPCY